MFDIEETIGQLTLEEKVRLLCGKNAWTLHGVERLGVPEITVTDGPHGVRLTERADLTGNREATVFPVAAAMGATWNPELIREMAAAIGREAGHMDVAVILGPGINGKRSPLGGRNFEYYSEDPYLTGRTAVAFVEGIQSEGVGACLKHYVGNEQETRRFTVDAKIDERALHELYLAPFALAIRRAGPWLVMGAYNSVNGEFVCQNADLLRMLLRERLGFRGLIVSDWNAVQDKVACHAAGLDLEMPGPGKRDERLLAAVQSGALPESVLDERVRRVLALIHRALTERRPQPRIDWPAHHRLAATVAEEAMVLLKNDGLLPLDPAVDTAVIGEFARRPRFQGGGSSQMNPHQLNAPWEAIRRAAPAEYADGYHGEETTDELIGQAVQTAGRAGQVVLFCGTTERMESEGIDREHIRLPEAHIRLIRAVAAANPRLVVVLHSGSALEVRQFEQCTPALLHAWLPGQAGGEALAGILFGRSEPSGRLSETFPVRLEHNPSFEHFPGEKDLVEYREGLLTGYRYYDTKKLPVQYPFGHGLGYTTFEYANLSVDVEQRGVELDLTNTGNRTGKEVVQVYVHDVASSHPRPDQELKGFAKVEVPAGATRRVRVELDESAFSYYVPRLKRFAVEAGEFEIRVGASSRDIRLKQTVTVESQTEVRPAPDFNDTVLDWLKDERTRPAMSEALKMLGYAEGDPVYASILGFPVPQMLEAGIFFGRPPALVEKMRARLLKIGE